MTNRERILATLGRRAPDRIPMDFGGTGAGTLYRDFIEAKTKENEARTSSN